MYFLFFLGGLTNVLSFLSWGLNECTLFLPFLPFLSRVLECMASLGSNTKVIFPHERYVAQ